MAGLSDGDSLRNVNSSGSSVVTNPISRRVDLAGPVHQVQRLARRLIAQIADRVRSRPVDRLPIGGWR
jgi:hypothetical protein